MMFQSICPSLTPCPFLYNRINTRSAAAATAHHHRSTLRRCLSLWAGCSEGTRLVFHGPPEPRALALAAANAQLALQRRFGHTSCFAVYVTYIYVANIVALYIYIPIWGAIKQATIHSLDVLLVDLSSHSPTHVSQLAFLTCR